MGRSAGVDGIGALDYCDAELARALRHLSTAIGNGTFVPNDHRQVQILKKNRKFRTLSIPVFAERVVARSFNNALLDVFDSQFPDGFHAYRRNRGILTLLCSIARAYTPDRPLFIGTADIENAFPNTPKEPMEDALREYVPDEALRNTLLRISYPKETQLGLPQGLATSPTLFTILLSHRLFRDNPNSEDDNTVILTYSDNLVYVSNTQERIVDAHELHAQELQAIGMQFKADQPFNPVNIAEGNVELLGTSIGTIKGRLSFRPGSDGWNKLAAEIRNSYLHSCPSDRAREVMSGWISHSRHIVHSFGVQAIVDRLRTYCSHADIPDTHWDTIGTAVSRAVVEWKAMVDGLEVQIPPEPEIWQYT